MDSSSPSGQSSDPVPPRRFLELVGIFIAILTLVIPFTTIWMNSSPPVLPTSPGSSVLNNN